MINIISLGKEVLEAIFGNQIMVVIFVLMFFTLIMLLIKIPTSIIMALNFIGISTLLSYALPLEWFIISVIVLGFIVASYVIGELAT
jgi:hypothetical protein